MAGSTLMRAVSGEILRAITWNFASGLRDQHYSYLVRVRQVRSIASWHRFNVDADFVRFLDSLSIEETTAVADGLSRLRSPVRDRSRLNNNGTVNE